MSEGYLSRVRVVEIMIHGMAVGVRRVEADSVSGYLIGEATANLEASLQGLNNRGGVTQKEPDMPVRLTSGYSKE